MVLVDDTIRKITTMLEIPRLTAREMDIAPLLVANATRSEIANHLSISEETVKHHTRNILRKFDATNVRDAFEALSEHLYLFGKDGLGLNYFCQTLERHLYLRENRVDAFVEENVVLEAIYKPMTEFVSEHFLINGRRENPLFNGEPFDKHERTGVNIASTKILSKPINPGEQLKYTTTADYIGAFPDQEEWFSVLLIQPIGVIDYWVHFNADDMPNEIWEHHYVQNASRHFEKFPIQLNNNVAHIRVNNPSLKKAYAIRWRWD